MPNRLAASTSPSMRQHAENPVDWREEAVAEARRRVQSGALYRVFRTAVHVRLRPFVMAFSG